jgi:hypothetical protein
MTKIKLILLLFLTTSGIAQKRKTKVSIKGEDFYINNQITFKGKFYKEMRIDGLLPNSRMVQGIYDDYNPQTVQNWIYPDTKTWNPDRNTDEFINAMPEWRTLGLLAFTLNLQGGNPYGYGKNQPWINTALKPDGSLDEKYFGRLEKIIDKADELGMVVILGIFYFGQVEKLSTEADVKRGVVNTCQWILKKKYQNVMIEVNNECDINGISSTKYDHEILQEYRVHELIELVKAQKRNGRRLLVSTSYIGGAIPSDKVLEVSDFVLIHGNSVHQPEKIEEMITIVKSKKSYKGNPVVINEDDHFDFNKPYNNFIAATKHHVSWGYFDYRFKNEDFNEGYQSVPANWKISSNRKKGFFSLLKEMTK